MKKIVLLGAGSTAFTLELVRDLVLTKALEGCRVCLVDIDENRLKDAAKVAELYRAEIGAGIGIEAHTDRRIALEGADYVICAVKIGGYVLLEKERKIAQAHGYYRGIGDRVSCYYGGVGAYWQIRFVEEVVKDMEELCPKALLIQTSNPVFEATGYAAKYLHANAVGVCHGHWGYREIAQILGLDPEKVTGEVMGFNHCVYLTDFRYEGKDAYPLIDQWIEEKSEAYWAGTQYNTLNSFHKCPDALSPGAVDAYRKYGLMPIGDAVRSTSPWWHHTDLAAKEKWYGKNGGFDSEICWNAYLAQKDEQREAIRNILNDGTPIIEKYPLRRSNEQHIQIIDAMESDRYTRLTLNILNNGCIPGLPDDILVEVPAMVSARGIQGIRMGAFPPKLMNNVILPRMCRANNIMEAYRTGDRSLLVLDLMNDHRTRSYEQAEALIDELLAQEWNQDAAKHYR